MNIARHRNRIYTRHCASKRECRRVTRSQWPIIYLSTYKLRHCGRDSVVFDFKAIDKKLEERKKLLTIV